MRGALLWLGGATVSLVAHVALFAFLSRSVDPDTVATQASPQTKLDIAAYQVDRVKARQEPAKGDVTQTQEVTGPAVAPGAIPTSNAQASAPESDPVSAQSTLGDALAPASTSALAPPIAAIQDSAAALAAVTPPQAAMAAASLPQSARIAEAAPAVATLEPQLAQTQLAAPLPVVAPATAAQAPQSEPLPQTVAFAPPATQTSPQADQVPSATLPSERAKAALAWSVGGKTVTDPISLAAIQAFMQPGDLTASGSNAGQVRDGIAGLLANVPCSRIQAAFDPDTGQLELRGHVPENGLRGPVLAALQEQVGAEIRVAENLLVLPRPQCGALSGISDVGLPQSTDQLTNTRLIGADAQAREYRYSQGQQLVFDLAAPDYDGVIYVDYFDADGQVIHLVPNEVTPLEFHDAKSVLNVGGIRADGSGLNITIGPPYGQEIAVAFASSVSLYDGVRPLTEPADAYLEFLKGRVAAARAENPDFKGEWVYFFITTAANP